VPGEPSSTNRSRAAAVQFFLAEFGALQQAHTAQLTVRDRQLNLYVILAAAISAASVVGLAMVRASNEQRFLIGVGVALIAFAVLGLILTYRAIQAQLSAVVYLRGMSRIRRYFITVDEAALEPYLVLPINDDEPRFSEVASGGVVGHLLQRDILAFINAWAVLLGTALLGFHALPEPRPALTLGASIVLAICWLALELALHGRQRQRAEAGFPVRFGSVPEPQRDART
jgi:hypothetical protein